MRRSRAEFKYALRQCKLHEEDMRAMALSNKLQNSEVIPFWRDIQSLEGMVVRLFQEELMMRWGMGRLLTYGGINLAKF